MTDTLERPDQQPAPRLAQKEDQKEAEKQAQKRAQKRARKKTPKQARTKAPKGASAPASPDDSASVIITAFTMIALVALWMAAQMLVLGALAHERAQDLLYSELRGQLANATAPVGPVVEVGAPVALLQIPELGLEQVVVEGTASGDTLVGPGHLRNSVLPGQVGTSVIFGRASTNGAPFAELSQLSPGDKITAVIGQGSTEFKVLGVRRSGDPLPQPMKAGATRVVLVTAEGSGRLSALRPNQAVYVDAEAAKGLPAPPGLPSAVPDPEKVMAGDPGAYPLLALCLGLLLALTLGVVAAVQRWSTALVWVVAAPMALALSWGTTDVVMRLLPNLI